MGARAKIVIENGPHGWYRADTDQTFTQYEVTIHARVEKLTYQRSLGEINDTRLFGVAKLDTMLCASGNPDIVTREVSLLLRGSVEKNIDRINGEQITGEIGKDEANQVIAHLSTHGLGAALSYYPDRGKGEPAMWYLEISLAKSDFEEIKNSYRARLLSSMLIRMNARLLVQESPVPGLVYLNWDNKRQMNKNPVIGLKFVSWV